jgi:hypothetical protein
MTELSAGVRALIGRMESNPEEFYDDAPKWRFMFGDRFREVMTEPEKGALHEGLKQVRRKEFDQKVMRELLKDEMEEQIKGGYYTTQQIGNGGIGGLTTAIGSGGFGQAQIHAEGMAVGYDHDTDSFRYASGTTALRNPISSLAIGKQTLSEEDIKRLKEATTSPSLFK